MNGQEVKDRLQKVLDAIEVTGEYEDDLLDGLEGELTGAIDECRDSDAEADAEEVDKD